jgi:hypothetical protein
MTWEPQESEMSGVELEPKRRKWTPDLSRAAERPKPEDWAMDEPMTLPEAVAVHWPRGPLKVATLRKLILEGRLPFTKLGKPYMVTREGLKVLGQCSLMGAAPDPGRPSIKSLLARHRAARNGIPGASPDASGR